MYTHLLKPILFRFDPETVHDFFTSTGEFLGRFGITRSVASLMYGYSPKKGGGSISKTVDCITYKTPVLLSAGFDYNGRLTQILPEIGFGGEEVGSVTARPCDGNPKPRLTRLPQSKSIIVNKGLRNEGVDKVIERLKQTVPRFSNQVAVANDQFVVGISIARTNDEKSAQSVQAGIDDYVYSFKRLNEEGVGDYYTINISCPNAFGGETFAKPELLSQLLPALMKIPCTKPVYVKMPINIPWDHFAQLLKIIDENKLQGVVIGNLNKDYSWLDVREEAPKEYVGGLSGKPCTHPSTDLIRKTKEVHGNRFTIIGVGGIMSPETAKEKFDAGADLIQLITGMIYEGPGLVKKIAKSL
ncbi:MAG TPA: quinone-dependent dihydroorotate dehydrogenase [Candidatus Paceibacterota bacterium]|jgi:dihydroorotate dehydrogenase subfamily 2|nr:quinone-dependent dihydroorotate dehydrogenase [Candidatus Paceibacterota bacterium]